MKQIVAAKELQASQSFYCAGTVYEVVFALATPGDGIQIEARRPSDSGRLVLWVRNNDPMVVLL